MAGKPYAVDGILQSAVAATGNGTAINVSGCAVASVQVTRTFVAVVGFEVSNDGTNYVAIEARTFATGAKATSASAAGMFTIDLGGAVWFRAAVTWTSGTSVTVLCHASEAGGGSSMADIDIAAAEAVTLAASSVAAAAFVAGSQLDGHSATLGAMANNRATQTDTTAVSVISLLKQISYMEQTPASRAVTIATAPATPTSELHIGEVGGNSKIGRASWRERVSDYV